MNPSETYHKWLYARNPPMLYRGVRIAKNPMDLWNYQEILTERGVRRVIEFGTYAGGSALFFADVIKTGVVFTVDINLGYVHDDVKRDPRIRVIVGASTSPEVLAEICEQEWGATFAILDSDHSKKNVLAEMNALRAVLKPGDYLVVEDGNINGHPVLPKFGDGPWEAIEEYFREFPEDYTRDTEREEKFGLTYAPKGYLIRR